ncbi:MAG: ABC transporter permease [Corynebacteriales bacterium]|nr:ABC transporter permease [Mycobacteriales bacterium]
MTATSLQWRPPIVALGFARGSIELRQFFRTRESVAFTILLPTLMLGLFGAIIEYDVIANVPFAQYFTPSMLAAGVFAASFQNLAIQIPMERDRGVHNRLAITPLHPMSYVLGKILLVLVISAFSIVIFLAVATFGYGVELPTKASSWFTASWVLILGVAACTMCGIAFSALPRTGRSAPAMVTPFALTLQIISGVFVPVDDLPAWLQQIGALFPLKWMCQGLRAAFLPENAASIEPAGSWELGRVAIVLGLWLLIGSFLAARALKWRATNSK